MTTHDPWADAAEATARAVAHLAVITYMAGFGLGLACHRLNDHLSTFWRRLVVHVPIPNDLPTIAKLGDEVTVDPTADVAEAVAQLQAMTHRQLMAVTGCRRKVAKHQLIALAIA